MSEFRNKSVLNSTFSEIISALNEGYDEVLRILTDNYQKPTHYNPTHEDIEDAINIIRTANEHVTNILLNGRDKALHYTSDNYTEILDGTYEEAIHRAEDIFDALCPFVSYNIQHIDYAEGGGCVFTKQSQGDVWFTEGYKVVIKPAGDNLWYLIYINESKIRTKVIEGDEQTAYKAANLLSKHESVVFKQINRLTRNRDKSSSWIITYMPNDTNDRLKRARYKTEKYYKLPLKKS